MLVLTRGIQQKIELGDRTAIVTVLEIKGGRVRLGIEAASDVLVRRCDLMTNDGSPEKRPPGP